MDDTTGTRLAVGLAYEQRSRLTGELLADALSQHNFADRVRPRDRILVVVFFQLVVRRIGR